MTPSRHIFIGDVQGCRDALDQLLAALHLDPATDRLLFCGDLVNRGGKSLQALRRAYSLRACALTVLGNHDLHLLAYAHAHPRVSARNREFEAILAAPDAVELLTWLRHQPLIWTDPARRLALVHAGVDPRWGPAQARACAGEVETALRGDDPGAYFDHMYGDRPRRWKPDQPRRKCLRTITNVFTRMRFCDPDGRLDFDSKGKPGTAEPGYQPWFHHLHPGWQDWTLVFGHWSTLGRYTDDRVVGLDTGCVWGGQLTALVVNNGEREFLSVDCARDG